MASLRRSAIICIFFVLPTVIRGWNSVRGRCTSLTTLNAVSREKRPRDQDSLSNNKLVTKRENLLDNNQVSTLDRPAGAAVFLQSYADEPEEPVDVKIVVDKDELNRGKTVILGLLWSIAAISALDRVAMSIALVPMTGEFGFTDSVKGSISSLFSVGYAFFIIPSGLLVASASPRLVMAAGITIWSLATIATPFATGLDSMAPLLFARACVGGAESCILPTFQRFLTTWTKAEEKSVALATVFSGFQCGTITAYLLSPIVMDTFGNWRYLFLVYGGFGLALLLPWLALARDGPDELIKQNEIQTLPLPIKNVENDLSDASDTFAMWKEAPWKEMLNSRASWGMLLTHCSKNWGLYNTLAWTPTFYFEQYGIGVRDSAILSVLPSVSGAVGGLFAGNLADYIIRNLKERTDESLTLVRKAFQSIALFGPALSLAILASNIPEDPQVAQFFLMAVVGFQAFVVGGFEAGHQEKAGKKWAGLLYSVTSLPPVLFGTFGVWFVGQILDATDQDWSVVFNLNAFINVLGATAFLLLYNSKKEFD